MSSDRLPGKVLRPLAGQPMLAWLIAGLRHAASLESIVVATSVEPDDDAIEAFCRAEGILVHRGPLRDVASRVAGAAEAHGLDVVVRISGDSPVLLPSIVDQVVSLLDDPDTGLATNVFPRSFPPGQSVEAIRTRVLTDALPKLTSGQQDHVTSWFYDNPTGCHISNLERQPSLTDVRLVVDTHDDLLAMDRLLTRLQRPHWEHELGELVLLRRSVAEDTT